MQVGVYDDGTWYVAQVETTYERGKQTGSDVVASRFVSDTLVELELHRAVEELMRRALQDHRQRRVAAQERE